MKVPVAVVGEEIQGLLLLLCGLISQFYCWDPSSNYTIIQVTNQETLCVGMYFT